MDDQALIGAWRAGDASAGEALVRAHYLRVFQFLCSKVDKTTSADLTQATFEALCQHPGNFRGQSSVLTYLYSIARNKLIDHLRSQKAHDHRFDPMEDSHVDPNVSQTMSSLLAGMERETLVAKALESLSLDDQVVLELKDYEGLTAREIAEILGIPPGTVASRLRKARQRLTEAVERLSENVDLANATLRSLDVSMRAIRERVRESLASGDGG